MDGETIHLFDKYSSGKLNGELLNDFEARLQSDADLKKKFNDYVNIVEGINEFERVRLKKFMRNPKIRFPGFLEHNVHSLRLIAVAAVLIILIVPMFIIYRTTTFSSRIVNEYYIKDTGLPAIAGTSVNLTLDKAMTDYREGKFREALISLDRLQISRPLNDTINYYTGICYFESDSTSKAIEYFQKIATNKSVYYYRATYDLGLAYIRSHDMTDAKKAFEIVSTGEPGPLKEKAAEILKKL